MSASDQDDQISHLVQLRDRTDVRVESKWILFAITSYILWTIFAIITYTHYSLPALNFEQTVGLVGTVALVASTGLSFLVYSLLNRLNKHAAREQELVQEVMNRVHSRTGPENVNAMLALSSTEQDFSSLLQRTREHSAILWSLLVLVPYAGWFFLIVALYLLTQCSNAHERMERLLYEDLGRTLTAGGFQPSTLSRGVPLSRNSAGFATASILTLGIVALAWLYVMVIGEDAHFRYHMALESDLLRNFPATRAGSFRGC